MYLNHHFGDFDPCPAGLVASVRLSGGRRTAQRLSWIRPRVLAIYWFVREIIKTYTYIVVPKKLRLTAAHPARGADCGDISSFDERERERERRERQRGGSVSKWYMNAFVCSYIARVCSMRARECAHACPWQTRSELRKRQCFAGTRRRAERQPTRSEIKTVSSSQ